VNLIFAHVNLGDKNDQTGADDRILTQFEAIPDPEDWSRFYAKHKREIVAASEAHKNNNS
jgi:hypothetical protein